MPIYHFNVHDGQNFPDIPGSVHADLDAARTEAVVRIGTILKKGSSNFWGGKPWHMDVADASGLTLFSLSFVATNAPLAPVEKDPSLDRKPAN